MYKSEHHPLKAGDILCASWGYSMTIVDFYEVYRITEKGAYLRRIANAIVAHDSYMSGKCIPNRDIKSIGTFFRRVDKHGRCAGHNSSAYAAPWSGLPVSFSHND
jgi:hypothetical protein